MRKNLVVLVALMTLTTAAAPQDGGLLAWQGKANPKAAMADAVRQGKPTILFFRREKCPLCIDLSAGAFRDAKVIELSKKFVCVFVECDLVNKNKALCDEFRVQDTPTLIFCDPDGNPMERLAGSVETASVIPRMEKLIKGYVPFDTFEKAAGKAKGEKKPVLYLFVKPNVTGALETALRDASLKDLVNKFILAKSVIAKDNADAKTLSISEVSLLVFDPDADLSKKEPILKLTGKKDIKEVRKGLEDALKKFQEGAGGK
jgi:thioredoxin-related protein